jgi:RNA polymerase sigma factor (sigma-70 family)
MKTEIENTTQASTMKKPGVRKSEDALFNSAYSNLYGTTFRYGIFILNNEFLIENIVQDAFLKLWNFRETIADLGHASRFLKQTIRWECYAYFRSPSGRFHRRLANLEDTNEHELLSCSSEPETQNEIAEDQLRLINNMLSFLPSGKEKSWLKLYYTDGLSHKQIAVRYSVSVQEVNAGLIKYITRLKTIIVRPNFFNSETNIVVKPVNYKFETHNIDGLNSEQSLIYRLRTKGKYEFSQIAAHLNLPQSYVQQQYVLAWKLVTAQKNKGTGHGSYLRAHTFKTSLTA